MKRSAKSFAKKASNLYQSIHQQLSVHLLAAVMAVVSVLALAQSTEAKIKYTPTHVVIGKGGVLSYNLDLNHDGVTDFNIENYSSWRNACVASGYVDLDPASGNRVVYTNEFAAALVRGTPIGPSSQFKPGGETMASFGFTVPCRLVEEGPWVNVTDHYLGLSFQLNGRTHYGWARLSVQFVHSFCLTKDSCYFIATLTGYAYETIAGKSIKAGQTKGAAYDWEEEEDFGPGASLTNPSSGTPQPATLGALAMGAPGLSIWRRKELALQGD
jgi:hypothetical protein